MRFKLLVTLFLFVAHSNAWALQKTFSSNLSSPVWTDFSGGASYPVYEAGGGGGSHLATMFSKDLSSPVWVDVQGGAVYPIFEVTGGGGSGTVTSVAMTVPSFCSVSGSPITTAGTLGLTFNTEAANSFLAGPVAGGSGAVGFRFPVAADIAKAVTPGTSGNVLTSDGTTWTSAPASGGGATVALDNLSATAINADLEPAVTNTIGLGIFHYLTEVDARFFVIHGGAIQSDGSGFKARTVVTDEVLTLQGSAGAIVLDSELGAGGTGNRIFEHGDLYMGLTTGDTPTWHIKLLAPPVDPSDAATKASSESYSPGTPSNWSGTPPATIKAALDRIAAVVSNGGVTPIP